MEFFQTLVFGFFLVVSIFLLYGEIRGGEGFAAFKNIINAKKELKNQNLTQKEKEEKQQLIKENRTMFLSNLAITIGALLVAILMLFLLMSFSSCSSGSSHVDTNSREYQNAKAITELKNANK